MGKRQGRDTGGTADLNCPRDIPYHIISCSAIKMWGSFSKVAVAQGLAGYQSAGGE